MVAVGLLYLLFDESILEQSKPVVRDQVKQLSWPISRIVVGAQVRPSSKIWNYYSNRIPRSVLYSSLLLRLDQAYSPCKLDKACHSVLKSQVGLSSSPR